MGNCGGWLLLYIGHPQTVSICGMQTTHKACCESMRHTSNSPTCTCTPQGSSLVDACAPQWNPGPGYPQWFYDTSIVTHWLTTAFSSTSTKARPNETLMISATWDYTVLLDTYKFRQAQTAVSRLQGTIKRSGPEHKGNRAQECPIQNRILPV